MNIKAVGWTLLLLLCASTATWAAPGAKPDHELKDLQQAIGNTQSQISQTTAEQKKLDQHLNQTQAQLAQAQAQLAQINQQHQQASTQLHRLQSQLDTLQTNISGAQAQVARLLNAHYRNRQPNAVMLFLKNDDTASKGRHLQYIRYLNQANEQVISRLQAQQQQLALQQAKVDEELKKLAQIKQRQHALLSRLGKQHQQQQAQSRSLDAKLSQQSRQLAELKDDEKQLNRLLQQLAKQAAAKRKAEAQARHQAAQARAQALAAAQAKVKAETDINTAQSTRVAEPPVPPIQQSTLTAEDMRLQAPAQATVDEIHQPSGFSRLQGRLKPPVAGGIIGQFGQTRPSGGTWKGLFIATPPSAVQSIAAGDVAYAASLRGYGNTVIVDHGDGYLSIYTGLSSINVAAGNRVGARQSLGRSGRLPSGEDGLYFEIRYRNQAMNPLSWLG